MLKTLFVLLLLGAAAVVGCGRGDSAGRHNAAQTVRAPVETVSRSPLTETYEAVGTVASRTTSVLASKVVGSVLAVNVHPGDEVKAGQLLVQISDKDASAELAAVQASRAEAEHALQEVQWTSRTAESAKDAADTQHALATVNARRASALLEEKVATQQQYDEAKAKLDTATADAHSAEEALQSLHAKEAQATARIAEAKAQVAAAEANLSYTRITSPTAGLVTMKNVEVGDMAVVGAPLLKVEDNTSYRLEVLVGESYMDRIKLGDEAPVTVDALPGKSVTGRVGEMVPASDAQSRSFVVKLDLPAVPGLRSGMFGRAAFAMGRRDAITVPSAAVVERGQLTSVYVVDGQGLAHLRLVRTGKAAGGRTEVLSGLSPGERIVAGKADQVHEGSQVEPGA